MGCQIAAAPATPSSPSPRTMSTKAHCKGLRQSWVETSLPRPVPNCAKAASDANCSAENMHQRKSWFLNTFPAWQENVWESAHWSIFFMHNKGWRRDKQGQCLKLCSIIYYTVLLYEQSVVQYVNAAQATPPSYWLRLKTKGG